jgi:molecular chaperone GrpE
VKFAELRLLVDLLPVLDDLDRFWQSLAEDAARSAWVEGVRLIDQKLRAALTSHGLSAIEAEGKEFDPYQHEAVMREEGDASELTTVVQELQRGYRLHDRVVRPSMVKVGKRQQEASASAEQGGA